MKIARFVIVTIIGLVVIGSCLTFAGAIPAHLQYAIRGGLVVLFAVLWLAARRGVLADFRPVFLAFLAITAGLTLAHYSADPIVAALHLNEETPLGSASQKFVQAALVILTVIVLMTAAGERLSSLYIRKGRLLLGLSLGLLGMAIFIVLTFLPGGPGLKVASTAGGLDKLLALAPVVALFTLSNAAMEELVFRAALLERYEALIGKWGALAATTIVFALAHVQVTYTSQLLVFLGMVLILGFLWGLLMQKSKGIWGSILFHAGADVAVILPLYQGMTGH